MQALTGAMRGTSKGFCKNWSLCPFNIGDGIGNFAIFAKLL